MPCIPAIPASCVAEAGEQVASGATAALGNGFAEAMRDGAAWVIKTTIGWWIDVPAVDLTSSPADTIRGHVLWLAAAVATVGVVWQGIVMAVSRRPEPVLTIGKGLLYTVLWSSVGIIGPAAALRAGDSFSTWVLSGAAGGRAADRLVELASLGGVTSPGAVIIIGLVMMLAGLAQAVLMLFREGAVVILAGVVVLAAAGSLTRATQPWLPRVVGWMLALICYKPAAALVYAAALALVGEGEDPRTVMVGLTMLVLAIVALPVLMKLFTWTTGAVTGGGGGLAALAGASAAAIHASAAFGGGSSHTATAHAAQLRQDLTPPGNSGPGGGSPSGASPAGPRGTGPGSGTGSATLPAPGRSAAASTPAGAPGAAAGHAPSGAATGAARVGAAGSVGAGVAAAQVAGAAAVRGGRRAAAAMDGEGGRS